MITDIHIKNFKCFEDFKMGELKRINLLCGKNNSGKTSVLEAIFLWCLPFSLVEDSSEFSPIFSQITSNIGPEWLFYRGIASQSIEIITGTDSRSFKTTLKKAQVHELRNPQVWFQASKSNPKLKLFKLTFRDSREGMMASHFAHAIDIGTNLENGLYTYISDFYWDLNLTKPNSQSQFLEAHSINLEKITNAFGKKIIVPKKKEQILPALKVIDSRLSDISTASPDGKERLYGDIGFEDMLPVETMGDGLIKLLEILMAIISNPKGIVLIDEIENGFHYSTLESVFSLIEKTAKEYNVQIFATTHSLECIEAAYKASHEMDKATLSVHRLTRTDTGFNVTHYDQEELASTIKFDFDPR